jgi:hypothetical protein
LETPSEIFVSVERRLLRRHSVYLGVDPEEIGVIAPYKSQVRAIRELLKVAKLSDISVGSVEEFQGQVGVDYAPLVAGTNHGFG